ncbi:N-acetylmuramoyl-L-alanine amidase [Candidatus Poribacteria bacterium]|nr:N-acetylmuramoyl-L-alanine amidase [Candidatus Poribacteria bacterium]
MRFSLFFFASQVRPEQVRFVDPNGALISVEDIVLDDEGRFYFPIVTLKVVVDPDLTHEYNALTRQLSLNLNGKRLKLRANSSQVIIQPTKSEVELGASVKLIKGIPHIPLSFFTKLIPQISEYKVNFNRSLSEISLTSKYHFQYQEAKDRRTVVIDPGHGGTDVGCESLNGIREKDVVLDVAKRIQKICQNNNIRVLLTRKDDKTYRPSQRTRIIDQQSSSLFLSLHCNASFSDKISGMDIWINNQNGQIRVSNDKKSDVDQNGIFFRPLLQDDHLEKSRRFAKILQAQLVGQSRRPIKIRENPLAILSNIYMPALLLELGYLSNLDDETKLQNETKRQEISICISEAIVVFLGSDKGK